MGKLIQNGYIAMFASVLASLRGLPHWLPADAHQAIALVIVVILWPYPIYRRLLDTGLPGWLAAPYYLTSLLVILTGIPVPWMGGLLLLMHAPLLLAKAGSLKGRI
jgi:hypothetical protein